MILVTGAGGFLGTHLLRVLQDQPVPVRALYHSRKPDEHFNNVEWLQCDLLDIYDVEEALQGVTHIYHCAAIVSFNPRRSDEIIDCNVNMTANLVNAALEADVQKLVHVSSIAALGRNKAEAGTVINEDTYFEEGKNNSNYSRGKYMAEMEVWRGMAEGLNAAIVNPGIILGEGDWEEGSANLMKIVYKEFPWYTEGINGWVDVKDVVKAMLILMNSEVSEERYILSAGNYGYLEVFMEMAAALGCKPPEKRAGRWMTELIWRVEYTKSMVSGVTPTISKETARTAQVKSYYDNSKMTTMFPEFQYTPLKETILRMAMQFKKDMKLK